MNHVETLNLRPGETVGMFGPDAAFLTTLPEHFGRVVGGVLPALRQPSVGVLSPARERGGCGADGDKYAGDVRDATGSATPVAGAPGSCSSGLHAGVSRHDTPPFRLRYSSGGQVRAGLGGGPDIPGALGLSGTTTATGTGTASRSQSPTDCDPPGRTTPLANFARLVAQTRLDGNGQQGQSPSGAVPCYGGGISGTGDVEGPATSTDNAIARYDGTTGKVIQNSAARIDDSGNLVADGSVTAKVQLRSEDGVVSKPGHAFVNDQATGMYREPGVLAFSVEGVSKLLLKKAGSDHIIAGNTTLQGNLTIDGDVTADNIGDVAAQGDGDKGDITVSSGGGTWTIDANAVTDAKLRDSAALSVIGRGANSTGDPADIAAGSDHQVLRRSGGSLGFGQIDLSQSAAVTGTLAIARGGTAGTDANGAVGNPISQATALTAPAWDDALGVEDVSASLPKGRRVTRAALIGYQRYAFYAYRNGNYNQSGTGPNLVTLNAELFDVNGAFDSSTNHRYQPTQAGYYQINAAVNYNDGDINRSCQAVIYKNGSEYSRGDYHRGGVNTSGDASSVSTLVFLNGSSDYVDLRIRKTDSGTQQVNGGSSLTYMSGFLAVPN